MADLRLLGIKNRWTQEKKITGPNVEWLIAEVERLQLREEHKPRGGVEGLIDEIYRRPEHL